MADQAEKAIEQARAAVKDLLPNTQADCKAEDPARLLAEGTWLDARLFAHLPAAKPLDSPPAPTYPTICSSSVFSCSQSDSRG
jgi:hypothetical protein